LLILKNILILLTIVCWLAFVCVFLEVYIDGNCNEVWSPWPWTEMEVCHIIDKVLDGSDVSWEMFDGPCESGKVSWMLYFTYMNQNQHFKVCK
jgi:hypothetical protein